MVKKLKSWTQISGYKKGRLKIILKHHTERQKQRREIINKYQKS